MVIGLDIIRAFELSWLNTNGKPQIACMEACFAMNDGRKIDTMMLKEYLNSFGSRKYAQPQEVYTEIALFFDKVQATPINLQFKFASEFTTKDLSLKSTALDYIISNNVRYICEHTKQPCTGSVLVDFIGTVNANKIVQQHLIAARNDQSNPQDYALKLLADESVVSLHLARKGGISWQIIRSNVESVDLQQYIQRTTIE